MGEDGGGGVGQRSLHDGFNIGMGEVERSDCVELERKRRFGKLLRMLPNLSLPLRFLISMTRVSALLLLIGDVI